MSKSLMMKYKKTLGIPAWAGLLALSVLGACSNDLLPEDLNKKPGDGIDVPTKLRLYVNFAKEDSSPETRFTSEADDGWSIGGSVNYFTDGDTVGIFTRSGNFNLPTTNGKGGPLINIPMYFEAQQYLTKPDEPFDSEKNPYETQYVLLNDTVEVLPSVMQSQEVFMYYPYTKDMGNLSNYPGWKNYVNTPNYNNGNLYYGSGYSSPGSSYNYYGAEFPNIIGLPLRVKADDGSIRCRDVVEMYSASQADLNKGTITGTVYHGFSSLQIVRNDGFKEPKRKDPATGQLVEDWRIWVVLDVPITHLRVVSYSDGVRWTTKPYYDPEFTIDGVVVTEEEAKKWEAWEGKPYQANNTSEPRRAWYVTIPTILHENSSTSWRDNTNSYYSHSYCARPTVSEIMLYDDDGYLQHVTSFTLKTSSGATATKRPYPHYRWRVDITMDELPSTVRPVAIIDWDQEGDDKDLTEERTAGIHDVSDYISWVSTYNAYIEDGRKGSNEADLKKYGDFVDNTYWNFYISEFIVPSSAELPQVTDMQDRLVGNNNFFNVTFSNFTIPGPMFKKVSNYGGIVNIDFRNVTVESDWAAGPIGMIAGEIVSDVNNNNVLFRNCNLYNCIVKNQDPVGLFAGSMKYGKIQDCEMSGFIMGTSTSNLYPKVFAIQPTNSPDVINFNYNNINSAIIQ